ncbi:MAG: type III-A CRISPR-associated protein Csm2 [Ignavibacteria bacterium]|jgi:CRISPR-associated protein Csm2|nr:type III-A CRISPR-associated protein Csm2 [Ignavibacteria bacterium]MCU7504470.1 type III-A CRISPR-associated protein Csm2 [Ignavibacteria bacterium]MCU7517951.1 type III-A CRISPR-associated protein Csm2 [Ignavibacteria bacterium]
MESDISDALREIPKWISQGLNQDAITFAEKLGRYLAQNKLSSSQIRNAFGAVKKMQMKTLSQTFDLDLLLMKPRLAYSVERRTKHNNQPAKDLKQVLSAGIDPILNSDEKSKLDYFQNFVNFFEAILAYYKAEGGI